MLKYLFDPRKNCVGVFTSKTLKHLIYLGGDRILVECPYFLLIGTLAFRQLLKRLNVFFLTPLLVLDIAGEVGGISAL